MELESSYRVPERQPAWRSVYRNLRLAILNRAIAPDTRIVEVALAETLGVSRTPLREALARLEADGLIAALKGGGYVITDPRENLADAYHLRAAIEGYAVRLAAEHVTEDQLQRLRENADANRRIDLADTAGRAALNAEFHRLLIEASRSPRLAQAHNNLREWVMTDEDMRLHSEEDCRAFVREHDLLIAALEMRDGDLAERLMRNHIRRAMALLLDRSEVAAQGLHESDRSEVGGAEAATRP
ncbi:MAG TPA: GntR family transcriptional regulator [Burkholderiaceae bacterium]|jgi:DNA-binding GntR family transcriptional regulator|nr:GntR family transcriptional regulator [Burkholderiaceae bacterium]